MRVCQGMHRLQSLHAARIAGHLAPAQRRHPQAAAARSLSVMASTTQLHDLHVHSATQQELDSAQAALQEARLVASKGPTPEETQYCALHFAGGGSSSGFEVPRYLSHLETEVLGRLVLSAGALPSTQSVIQDNVATLPDGTVCVADRQVGGRGRGGNKWESPEGCLMFSVCKRLGLPGQRLPFVQYLVSLAAVQAVQDQARRLLQGGTVDVRIKWPNDLYSGGLKLGGVLCHSSYRGQLFYVTMGVGLNVSNRQPTTCVDALIEAEAQRSGLPPPAPVSREELLAGLMSRLEPMLGVLCSEGFGQLEGDYYEAWLHSGQEVQVEEEGRLVPVRVRGLSQHGYLEAEDLEGGGRYELHPDGNSFDFFKGLVRKKIN